MIISPTASNDDSQTSKSAIYPTKPDFEYPKLGCPRAISGFKLRRKQKKREKENYKRRSSMKAIRMRLSEKIDTRAKKIDMISRFLFPAAFMAFNIMYWVYYLLPYMR